MRIELKSQIFLRRNKPICRIYFAIRRVHAIICNKGTIITSKLYKKQKMKYLKSFPLELFFWITALVLLGVTNSHEHHFTLCPLANLGFEQWCPGCGVGRSISHILHGEFTESFKEHWFGFPALLILMLRIFTLIKYKTNKKFSTVNT